MQEVLNEINLLIDSIADGKTSALFKHLTHGKMVRAKLITEIGGHSAIKLGAIIELIHLASLLHDDVIDKSDTRRGRATINSIFGEHTAIMLGDILYSKAFSELVWLAPEIASKVANAVTRLSVGELADVGLGEKFNEDEQIYMQMIYDKTASLIEASCYGAAKIAGLNADALGQYGKALGVAFQLVDDMLDIYGDEAFLGKPSFNDFKEGKTTIPYIMAYKVATDEEKKQILDMFKCEQTKEQKEFLLSLFDKYDIKNQCEQIANNAMIDGLIALKNSDASDELKQILIGIAQKLLGRTF